MTMTLILSLGFLALLCYTPPGTEQKSEEWQNDPQCGSPKFKPATNGRIVGGSFARAHSWPWQALLLCQTDRRSLSCGATLISNRWIITAAHCLTAVLNVMIVERNCIVTLGKHYADRREATQQTSLISEFLIHESYVMGQAYRGNDLALLKLKNEISYNNYVLPVCLPFGLPELANESNCYATGWGRFDAERSEMSSELKQLYMPVEDAVDLCGVDELYTDALVCAGSWQRGEDVCKGDSGGPLTCKENNGKWYLRGVTSLGDIPCQSYGIFTKVNFFKEWIESTVTND